MTTSSTVDPRQFVRYSGPDPRNPRSLIDAEFAQGAVPDWLHTKDIQEANPGPYARDAEGRFADTASVDPAPKVPGIISLMRQMGVPTVTDRSVHNVPAIDMTDLVKSSGTLTGGANGTYFIEYDDNGQIQKSVFKPVLEENPRVHPAYIGRQSIAEVSAFIVSESMGLDLAARTRHVVIGEKRGSLADFVNDTAVRADETLLSDRRNASGIASMLYFDALIGNSDRHLGNWLIRDGEVKPIDNGMSFARNSDYQSGKLKFRGFEHDPTVRQTQPMPAEFAKGLDQLVANQQKINVRLKNAGLEDANRDSFWKRVDYLRKTKQLDFNEMTLKDIARLAEGLDLT